MADRSELAARLARACFFVVVLIGSAGCRDVLGFSSGALVDAATEADAAASPDAKDAWMPSKLAGLAVWLDASNVRDETKVVLDGMGRATRWLDLSGNDNDARPYDADPDSGIKTLTPRRDIGIFANGKDALAFADASGNKPSFMVIWDAPSVRFGQGDFLVALVARCWNSPAGQDEWGGYAELFNKPDSQWPHRGVNFTANVPSGASVPFFYAGVKSPADLVPRPGIVSTLVVNDGKFHRLIGRRSGATTMSQWFDGTFASASGVDSVSVNNTNDVVIGGYHLDGTPLGGVNAPLWGHIAEIVAVKGPVSDSDVMALDAYFAEKFDL